jgi:hypothetical protein
MGKRPCDFKESNIIRAKRAAEKAGYKDATIEITSNGVTVRITPNTATSAAKTGNEWDALKAS